MCQQIGRNHWYLACTIALIAILAPALEADQMDWRPICSHSISHQVFLLAST